jgi:hypothetical protein
MTPRTRPTAALPFLDLDALKSIGKSPALKDRASFKREFRARQVFEHDINTLGKEYHGSLFAVTSSQISVFRNRKLNLQLNSNNLSILNRMNVAQYRKRATGLSRTKPANQVRLSQIINN